MQSRRELLLQGLALPLLARPALAPKFQVISGSNCLCEESAEGFSTVLRAHANSLPPRQLIVVAGVTQMLKQGMRILRSSVEQGAWLIWESAGYESAPMTLLEESFDLKTNCNSLPSNQMYVRYRWPTKALIRGFGRIVPLECPPEEAIAQVANRPVALRKQIGKGTLIFLGSMLGPHLRGEDREATQLARDLLLFRS